MTQARRWEHALIVGGTGMLREASVFLARHSRAVTSLARTAPSLEALDETIRMTGARHLPRPVDYHDAAAFASVLDEAIQKVGPPDLVLAWIHGLEPAFTLADRIGRGGHPFDFFQVLGSPMSDPAKSREDVWRRFRNVPGLTYHRIMLGFVIEESRSRWLTNEEISVGVIHAIDTGADVTTTGSVRPWSARPPRR